MKKISIVLGIFVFILAACQGKAKNQESTEDINTEELQSENIISSPADLIEEFYGSWIEPNPINTEQVQGIALKEDSIAESINKATLATSKWWVDDSNLYLIQQSIGNGITTTDTVAFEVDKISSDSLILRDGELFIYYRRQK